MPAIPKTLESLVLSLNSSFGFLDEHINEERRAKKPLVLVPISFQSQKEWTIQVPIGDINDLEWIPYATLAVILSGILIVLASLYHKLYNVQKLEKPTKKKRV